MDVIIAHNFIHEMMGVIFHPEYRRLGNWINRLCQQNRELYNDPELLGFIYEGLAYKPTDIKISDKVMTRRALHVDLHEDMHAYIADLDVLIRDKSFVSQTLFKLLDPCENMDDIRDALPECLVNTLPSLQGKSRGRPEAYTIEGDPRAKRQYEKILPKIEMYAAGRLLY